MALEEPRNEKASNIDWPDFRRRSLQPGGFGPSRLQIWPEILGVHMTEEKTENDIHAEAGGDESHRDEHQIHLDTDRSFVLYPVDTPMDDKSAMQEKLNTLLVSIFRRHPRLNYFQGYHDIVSVLFLTLPEELQFACAEKISLHRVRDSMGTTLEPILGLLRVTKNLLRLADLEYAQFLERSSQLPFYALSNLLTLFSHDTPTLPLIQHIFDYILCRPPIAIVYLATAIILSRREAVLRQFENGDDDDNMGMSHSILSSMPPMTDAKETPDSRLDDDEKPSGKDPRDEETRLQERTAGLATGEDTKAEAKTEERMEPMIEQPSEGTFLPTPPDPRHDMLAEESVESTASLKPSLQSSAKDIPSLSPPEPPSFITEEAETHPAIQNPIRTPPTSRPSSPLCYTSRNTEISLSSLLSRADELYSLYPPTHPDLCLSSIMGPQSVIYTWSESISALPTDAEAESMVLQPGLVVYPYIEMDDVIEEEEEEDSSDELDEKTPSTPTTPKRKRFRARKMRGKVKDKLKRLGLRQVKVDQTTGMVAGAVIVLGIAMAVYGVSMRDSQQGLGRGVSDVRDRDWRRVATWFGAVVAGVTEKVAEGLSMSMPPHGQR